PRPPNAWILYRSERLRSIAALNPGAPRLAQADISKQISGMWKNESDEVRAHYEHLAKIKKMEHQLLYPSYRFQP
ncbi:high mobility group box, partial [Rickenella mellea]